MRTDDELTLLLRAGFDAATEHLAASPALATQVRRRHRVAQRRRLAVGVALPAAATAVGTVLAVGGGRAPGPAPIAEPSAAQSGTVCPDDLAPAPTGQLPVGASDRGRVPRLPRQGWAQSARPRPELPCGSGPRTASARPRRSSRRPTARRTPSPSPSASCRPARHHRLGERHAHDLRALCRRRIRRCIPTVGGSA